MSNIRKLGMALLAIISLFACQREVVFLNKDHVQVQGNLLTFTATIDEGQATRTSLSNSKVVWNTNEEINIFYGSSEGSLFTSTNDSPGTSVSFEGTLSAFTGSTEVGEAISFWSVYPYNVANSCSGTAVSAYLPEKQVGILNNIPDKTMMMLAKTPGMSLSFKQVCAVLRVVINRPDIEKVVIRGNQGEVLAGRVSVSMDDDDQPIWSVIENEGSTEITLMIPQDDNTSSTRYYYLGVLPQTFASGISVTYYTPTLKGEYVSGSRTFGRNETYAIGSAQVSTWVERPRPNSITFSPSHWDGELGDETRVAVKVSGPEEFGFVRDDFWISGGFATSYLLDSDAWCQVGNDWLNTMVITATSAGRGEFMGCYRTGGSDGWGGEIADLEAYGTMSYSLLEHGEEIVFADPLTESICLASYDRNGDGVLTVDEAAAVTTLLVDGESPFNRPGNDDTLPKMTSFDELQYFTGLTEIPDYAFNRQFSLSSVILPEQITSIGVRAFCYCAVLQSIEIPDRVGTIGDYAFAVCNSLQEVTIPSSVYTIGKDAFFSCANLSSVIFEEGNLNTIGDGAFSWDTRLASLDIPDSVTSFGIRVFEYSKIGHVRLPSSLTILPKETFYCARVYEIEHDNWDQITEIGESAFGAYGASYSVTVPRALPTGLKTIGNKAFQYAILPEGFALPAGVTSIGDNAFRYAGLTTIELPATLSTIGYGAFSNCALEKVYVKRTTPAAISQLGSGVLSETFGTLPALNGTILVPYDKAATYKSSWATWADYIQNDSTTIPGGGNIGDDGDLGDGGDA